MDGVDREVNVMVLRKWLELLCANGGRFEINQLLFADDTALVADIIRFSTERLPAIEDFTLFINICILTVCVCNSSVSRESQSSQISTWKL